MNNVLETNGVPLTVFGGAVPEMAPEDLPEGASPWNQDVDYSPGSVFTRGGRQNQFVLSNLFVSKLPAFAQSIPGTHAPNEIVWSSPTNIELGTPGTYASTTLAHSGSIGGALGPYIDALNQNALNSDPTGLPLTLTTSEQDFVAYFLVGFSNPSFTAPPAGFTDSGVGTPNQIAYGNFPAGTNINITPGTTLPVAVAGIMVAIPELGSTSLTEIASTSSGGGLMQCTSNAAIAATDVLFAVVSSGSVFVSNTFGPVTDTEGNNWILLTQQQNVSDTVFIALWMCVAPIAVIGGTNITYSCNVTNAVDTTLIVMKTSNLTTLAPSQSFSQVLQASSFGFSIPANQSVLGMQIEIDGHQTSQDPSAFLNVTIGNPTSPATPTFKTQLPASDGAVLVGTPTTNWGLPLTPALVNSPTLKVNVVAQSAVNASFLIYGVKLKVWFASNPANINWLKSYEQTDAEVDTLVLDANGVLWDENASANPGVLTGIFTGILPNTFAKSVTFDDIEYIAFSNLLNGTDIPRQWNGTNLDRISMVGPGAPCSATAQAAGNTIVSITQAASTQIRRIAWGASSNAINDSTPGNQLVIFGEGRTGSNTYASLPNAVVGGTIVLSGLPATFPLKGGGSLPYNLNGTYTVLQVTTAIVGGNEVCPVFVVQAPATAYGYSSDFGSGGTPTSGWFYQATLATMTTSTPVPNLGVGNQFQIAGTGGAPTAGYDGTWTVVGELNGAQLQINSTQLTSGIASFAYTLVSGTAPVAGQLVTVTGTLNGNGIFNVSQVQITAASPGSFSVAIPKPDVSVAAETGQGIIFGTQFTFDPLVLVGNKTGGTIVAQGQIGIGVRKVCYSYLTRSGFVTQPSPIFTFDVLAGSAQILVTGLLPGPPNVIARIVHLTGANGGNFFNIPQPVTVISNGVSVVNTSTWVNDNTTTSILLSFADGVLLSATAIDIPGNNLFSDIELGSCRGLLTYASRMIAWSEQNKITNLRNISFDGGILGATVQGVTTTYPAGWTVDPNLGAGASVVASPVFGFAYQISNSSGITQTQYGMITQPAYQDEFLVPIVNPAVLYSVRVTASCPTGAAGGNLIVDLFSPKFGAAYPGFFSIPLSSMTSNMQIFTGTLLVPAIAPVPSDLVIRIWAQNIPTGVVVQLDRCEPFPTLTPVLTTQLKASYAGNQEAFDLVTGACGPDQNQQPINGVAGDLFDLLYVLKERSAFSVSDNGVTEPNQWGPWKTVSEKTGTIGIHSYDYGEGWLLTADRQGVHFFEGGEPIKVSQEIQPLWDLINWKYGHTIWLRNDPEQKRFTVGVPIATPNAYMPEFPVNANPTQPNVVLMCNYRELNTGAMMASTPPIKATYTGRIMAPEPARKWSFWNIASPYSDFIDRADNNWPQFFASGYGDSKVFSLLASALSDDGNAINSFYITYGFVKPETADAKGLGLFRMEVPYMTILAVGSGTLSSFVYPESPQNLPFTLDPLTLSAISQGDLEVGVNVKGQRFFIRWGTNSVGSAWRVSKVVLPLLADTWSPIRGTMSGSV